MSDAPLTLLVQKADTAAMRRVCLTLARPGIRFVLHAAEENARLLSLAAEVTAKGSIVQFLIISEISPEDINRRILEDFGSFDAVLAPPEDGNGITQ